MFRNAFTYPSVTGAWHDVSRDLRLHLLGNPWSKNKKTWLLCSSYAFSRAPTSQPSLPFLFPFLVNSLHGSGLQLSQRWGDKLKHGCDTLWQRAERLWDGLIWTRSSSIYMCTAEVWGVTASLTARKRKSREWRKHACTAVESVWLCRTWRLIVWFESLRMQIRQILRFGFSCNREANVFVSVSLGTTADDTGWTFHIDTYWCLLSGSSNKPPCDIMTALVTHVRSCTTWKLFILV